MKSKQSPTSCCAVRYTMIFSFFRAFSWLFSAEAPTGRACACFQGMQWVQPIQPRHTHGRVTAEQRPSTRRATDRGVPARPSTPNYDFKWLWTVVFWGLCQLYFYNSLSTLIRKIHDELINKKISKKDKSAMRYLAQIKILQQRLILNRLIQTIAAVSFLVRLPLAAFLDTLPL